MSADDHRMTTSEPLRAITLADARDEVLAWKLQFEGHAASAHAMAEGASNAPDLLIAGNDWMERALRLDKALKLIEAVIPYEAQVAALIVKLRKGDG